MNYTEKDIPLLESILAELKKGKFPKPNKVNMQQYLFNTLAEMELPSVKCKQDMMELLSNEFLVSKFPGIQVYPNSESASYIAYGASLVKDKQEFFKYLDIEFNYIPFQKRTRFTDIFKAISYLLEWKTLPKCGNCKKYTGTKYKKYDKNILTLAQLIIYNPTKAIEILEKHNEELR